MISQSDVILLVGAGPIAAAYTRCLKQLGQRFAVVGRSEQSCQWFAKETGVVAHSGGLSEKWLREGGFGRAIVAVTCSELGACLEMLVGCGVGEILAEKPGGMAAEVLKLAQLDAKIYVAYNRRFLPSVVALRQRIHSEGGVVSFHFDFSEDQNRVQKTTHPAAIKEQWLLFNSSHLIDLAFFLGGEPVHWSAQIAGRLPWHSRAGVFAGSGKTDLGALFSYHANWSGAGRWRLEVSTPSTRYLLAPLETLHAFDPATGELNEIPFDCMDDPANKPGFLRQTEAFLVGDRKDLLTLREQAKRVEIYEAMLSGLPRC